MTDELPIACDEAWHTGPDLLHKDQRYFAFSSVCISDDEAQSIIKTARRNNPVQMPELKASKLIHSDRGQALIAELFEAVENRFAVNVHDKLLALCGWVFEYIYEPVYQADPGLLYEKNFHRFVAMFAYLWFSNAQGETAEAIRQFQAYMRSRDENDAPLLFRQVSSPLGELAREEPFDLILRFARGYRDLIVADNSRLDTVLPDAGRWTLDLSASGLWSHLNFWGGPDRPLQVTCDASKPLQSIVSRFKGDEHDPAVKRARLMGYKERLGWRLAGPIRFADSRNHPAIQLADVIAGVTVTCITNGVPEKLSGVVESIQKHMLRDTILPDLDVIDLKQRGPAVNYLILYDLAQRAERGQNPYEGLQEMYRAAEVRWVRGGFKVSQ